MRRLPFLTLMAAVAVLATACPEVQPVTEPDPVVDPVVDPETDSEPEKDPDPEPVPALYLNVSPAADTVGYEAGLAEFTVDSNVPSFEVSIDSEWIGLVSQESGTVKVSYGENTEQVERSAEVLFSYDTLKVAVRVVQAGHERPAPVDLSETETANSYIVPQAGDYCFDVSVTGNGEYGYIDHVFFYPDDVYLNPVDAKVIWADEGVIDSLRFENGKVYFTAGGAKGNALVAAYGKHNNVLWSWHLWFTDQPSEVTHTNGDGESFTLLDRNLGATSADPADGMDTYGLYYQYGRKDPLRGVQGFRKNSLTPMYNMTDEDASYYLIQESISTPDRFISAAGRTSDWASNRTFNVNMYLWGNPYYNKFAKVEDLDKTIYDPCPPGYLIAPGNTWEGVSASDMERLNNGFWFNTTSGKNFYAAAGSVGGGDAAGQISDGWYYFAEDIDDYTREQGMLYACMWTSQAYYYSGDYATPYGGKEFRVGIPFDYDSRTTYGNLSIQPNKGEGRRLRGFSVRCMKEVY